MCQCTPEIRTPYCGKGNCQWPEQKVSSSDGHKPHLTVNCGESVHVVPVALIEDVIEGKKDFTQLERWDVLLKTILKDWLASVRV